MKKLRKKGQRAEWRKKGIHILIALLFFTSAVFPLLPEFDSEDSEKTIADFSQPEAGTLTTIDADPYYKVSPISWNYGPDVSEAHKLDDDDYFLYWTTPEESGESRLEFIFDNSDIYDVSDFNIYFKLYYDSLPMYDDLKLMIGNYVVYTTSTDTEYITGGHTISSSEIYGSSPPKAVDKISFTFEGGISLYQITITYMDARIGSYTPASILIEPESTTTSNRIFPAIDFTFQNSETGSGEYGYEYSFTDSTLNDYSASHSGTFSQYLSINDNTLTTELESIDGTLNYDVLGSSEHLLSTITHDNEGHDDWILDCAIGPKGNIYAVGFATSDLYLPATERAFRTDVSSPLYWDIFIEKYSADGKELMARSYICSQPSKYDSLCIDIDTKGNIYIAGTNGLYTSAYRTIDAYLDNSLAHNTGFLCIVSPDLSLLKYSTLLSSYGSVPSASCKDIITDIEIIEGNNFVPDQIILAGYTDAALIGTTPNAIMPSRSSPGSTTGNYVGFINSFLLDDMSSLYAGTYFYSSSGSSMIYDMEILEPISNNDPNAGIYFCGTTEGEIAGATNVISAFNYDPCGYIAKLDFELSDTNHFISYVQGDSTPLSGIGLSGNRNQIYSTGYSSGTEFGLYENGILMGTIAPVSTDGAFIIFDIDGSPKYSTTISCTDDYYGTSIYVDPRYDNTVILLGSTDSSDLYETYVTKPDFNTGSGTGTSIMKVVVDDTFESSNIIYSNIIRSSSAESTLPTGEMWVDFERYPDQIFFSGTSTTLGVDTGFINRFYIPPHNINHYGGYVYAMAQFDDGIEYTSIAKVIPYYNPEPVFTPAFESSIILDRFNNDENFYHFEAESIFPLSTDFTLSDPDDDYLTMTGYDWYQRRDGEEDMWLFGYDEMRVNLNFDDAILPLDYSNIESNGFGSIIKDDQIVIKITILEDTGERLISETYEFSVQFEEEMPEIVAIYDDCHGPTSTITPYLTFTDGDIDLSEATSPNLELLAPGFTEIIVESDFDSLKTLDLYFPDISSSPLYTVDLEAVEFNEFNTPIDLTQMDPAIFNTIINHYLDTNGVPIEMIVEITNIYGVVIGIEFLDIKIDLTPPTIDTVEDQSSILEYLYAQVDAGDTLKLRYVNYGSESYYLTSSDALGGHIFSLDINSYNLDTFQSDFGKVTMSISLNDVDYLIFDSTDQDKGGFLILGDGELDLGNGALALGEIYLMSCDGTYVSYTDYQEDPENFSLEYDIKDLFNDPEGRKIYPMILFAFQDFPTIFNEELQITTTLYDAHGNMVQNSDISVILVNPETDQAPTINSIEVFDGFGDSILLQNERQVFQATTGPSDYNLEFQDYYSLSFTITDDVPLNLDTLDTTITFMYNSIQTVIPLYIDYSDDDPYTVDVYCTFTQPIIVAFSNLGFDISTIHDFDIIIKYYDSFGNAIEFIIKAKYYPTSLEFLHSDLNLIDPYDWNTDIESTILSSFRIDFDANKDSRMYFYFNDDEDLKFEIQVKLKWKTNNPATPKIKILLLKIMKKISNLMRLSKKPKR